MGVPLQDKERGARVMGWHWDGTRHKAHYVSVLKNGTQKVAFVWQIDVVGKWVYAKHSPNHQDDWDGIGMEWFGSRKEIEDYLYEFYNLKRADVPGSSTARGLTLLDMMRKKNE